MNSGIRQKILLLIIAAMFLFPFPHSAGSETGRPRITDLIVTNTEKDVLLYFSLHDSFTSELEEAVFAGITTTFIFTVELYRHRGLWLDRKEAVVEARHSIKYDNIKRTLHVSYAYQGLQRDTDQFTEMARAKRAMTEVSALPITTLDNLERGRPYYFRVRARLDRVPLPMDIRAAMVFSPLWYFETDWARQDFVY